MYALIQYHILVNLVDRSRKCRTARLGCIKSRWRRRKRTARRRSKSRSSTRYGIFVCNVFRSAPEFIHYE